MKKFVIFCVVFTIVSFLFQMGWTGYRSSQSDHTEQYGRFHTSDDNFNWWSLISPLQSEAQKISGYDTVRFSHKVIYPYGRKFNLVEPESGFTPEKIAADEITKVINDSISRIKVNYLFDYDGTSASIRQYSNPQMVTVEKLVAFLSAFGTASPEAKKYGFAKSIQPGHIEQENLDLAKARLNRTADFLETNGFKIVSRNSTEIQFNSATEANLALANPSILDSMRYVLVNVTIPIQKLEVTTMTLPIMLPLWLVLSVLGLSLIPRLRRPRVKIPKVIKPKVTIRSWNWIKILEIIKITLFSFIFVLLTVILLTLTSIFWIILTIVLICLFLIWHFRKFIRIVFGHIWDIIVIFFLLIWRVVRYIYNWIIEKFEDFAYWWSWRTTCQKVLAFVMPYAILMTALAIYLWLKCPC